MEVLIGELENRPTLIEQLTPYRFHLCLGAIHGGSAAVLKRIKSWRPHEQYPKHPSSGTNLLAAALLRGNAYELLQSKWKALSIVGASNPKKMKEALQNPLVFTQLMEYAGQVGNTYCFDLLVKAHEIGVDLLSVKGADGRDIIASIKERKLSMVDQVAALVERHQLEAQTPASPAPQTPRRRM